MNRRPELGSISTGTLRTSDLCVSFLEELERLDPERAGDIRSEYADILPAIKFAAMETVQPDIPEDAMFLLEAVHESLDALAPPYTYFGSHPGDGAEFGFWPAWDMIEEDRRTGELPSGPSTPDERTEGGLFLTVSDHGNAELYVWRDEEWRSVWSVV